MTNRPGRFLFTTWDAAGGLAPLLGLAQQLVHRGHDVRVLGDGVSEPAITRAGLAFERWEHAPSVDSRDPEATRHRGGMDSGMKAFKLLLGGLAYGPAAEHARDVIDAHRRSAVDVVVAEQFLPGAIVAGRALGLGTALVVPNIDMRPSANRPPPGPGFAPRPGPVGWLRDNLVSSISRRMIERVGLEPLNDARAQHGLAPLQSVFEQQDEADRVLILSSPSFDWATAGRDNARYVGPLLDDPVWGGDHDQHRSTDRPLVLVSLGTTPQDQRRLYERAIEALATLPVEGVVTTADVYDPAGFDAPENVTVLGTAPHGPLMARASAAVIHCGHGSSMRALTAGTPAVCIPLGRDQNDNAARIAHRGAGIRLSPRTSAAKIRAAIDAVLTDDSYRNAATALGQRILADARPAAGLEELEALAEVQSMQTR